MVMLSEAMVLAGMKVVWECEAVGNRWDDLWEYPYSDAGRKVILVRLERAVRLLAGLMAEVR